MRVKKIFQFEGFKISANASRVIITVMVMVVHEKGGNKVREQTFKFRSSTFIYAWNYPPIRFIFFFLFLCWRIRIPLSLYFFFYFSRNSWSFSFSPILINFSSKIFIRFLQLKYFQIDKYVSHKRVRSYDWN